MPLDGPAPGAFPFDPAELVERCDYSFSSQQNFRNTMERKRVLLLPDASPFFVENQTQGQRDRATTVDTYAQYMVRTHATFLFGSIVTGDDGWMKVGCSGHKGAEEPSVKAWAAAYTKGLHEICMDPSSGFIEQFWSMLLERSAFDNARLFVGDRPGALPIFRMTPMRDSSWEAGVGHEPETHWWPQSLTNAEWVRKFPNRDLGEAIRAAAANPLKRNDQQTVLHGAIENPGWTPSVPDQAPPQRRILTFWISRADKHLISHAWLTSNPYTAFRCPRRPNEILGRGASDEVLEEAQMAQRVRVAVIRGFEGMIDPVMILPDDGVTTPPTNDPQGAIVVRADMLTGRGGDPIRYLRKEGQPDKGQEWLQGSIYEAIGRAYNKDLMTLPREPRMLDSQMLGIQEEQARGVVPLLSPIFAPLGRVLQRTADIAMRAGQLPRPPAAARGLNLHIEFRNPMERASRLAEVRAFSQALDILIKASQVDPSARHALKVVEGVQECARILGVPEKLITPAKELAKLIEADSQAMQQKNQSEQMLDGSTVMKNAGGALKNFITPEMMQGAMKGGPQPMAAANAS